MLYGTAETGTFLAILGLSSLLIGNFSQRAAPSGSPNVGRPEEEGRQVCSSVPLRVAPRLSSRAALSWRFWKR